MLLMLPDSYTFSMEPQVVLSFLLVSSSPFPFSCLPFFFLLSLFPLPPFPFLSVLHSSLFSSSFFLYSTTCFSLPSSLPSLLFFLPHAFFLFLRHAQPYLPFCPSFPFLLILFCSFLLLLSLLLVVKPMALHL